MKNRATSEQLELLADYEGIEIDDLLDEGLSQKAVLYRLRQAATPGVIPIFVLERRRERERLQGMLPGCRICTLNGWECEGRITRHHFVPRWLMLELESYQLYSSRSICTIPICIGRHRDLHLRDEMDKSIIPYLRRHERLFAQGMLDELKDQHPKIYDLLFRGDFYSYEAQLVQDHEAGCFLDENGCYDLNEYITVQSDTAVAVAAQ